MKTILFLPVFIFLFHFPFISNPPMPDPSAVYCVFLGYKYDIRKDAQGNEYGVCIFPDGSECHSWDFYRGKCGGKYSYCARKGCETKSITEDKEYKIEYCACKCVDSAGKSKVIPLDQFMLQNGDTIFKFSQGRKGGL